MAIESENTDKPKSLTMSEEIPPMVDQIRFFAGAARVLEGRSQAIALEFALDPARPVDRDALKTEIDHELAGHMKHIACTLGEKPLPLVASSRVAPSSNSSRCTAP